MKWILVPELALAVAVSTISTMTFLTGAASAFTAMSFLIGNDLLAKCEAPLNSFESVQCVGYIEGVSDAYEALRVANGATPCPPVETGIQANQIKDVVVRALIDDPIHRNAAAAPLAINAINAAWGCGGTGVVLPR